MTSDEGPPRRRRRAPAPEERQVNAERSRTALLQAALDEFASKGFAGARVRDIAERAGVSKDLIAYHFGDKSGLYAAVQRAWLEGRATDPDASLADALSRLVHDTLADPRPMRLKIWRGLAPEGDAPPDVTRDDEHPQATAATRRRQDGGELHPDLDPATTRLLFLAAVAAPVIFPDDVRRLFGVDPADPRFEARYRDGLQGLLHLLRGPKDGSA